jgi:S1-C subfamily serine protease
VVVSSGSQAVRIGEIEPDGPAAKSGLSVGDIILTLDGISVQGADDLIRLLDAQRIGRTVEILVLRAGRTERVAVTLAERHG